MRSMYIIYWLHKHSLYTKISNVNAVIIQLFPSSPAGKWIKSNEVIENRQQTYT